MKTVDLKAEVRTGSGKAAAKKVRAKNMIPAVVYGAREETLAVQVDFKELERVLHTQAGENVLISLRLDEGGKKKERTVLIKDIQHDPLTDRIQHIDFNAISLSEKIRAKVPLHDKGECPGVKEGGVVDHAHREIEVECLPADIPDRIDIDISGLNINDVVLARDIALPGNVVMVTPPDEILIKVLAPKKEEAPVEEAAAEAKAEPEVITAKRAEPAEAGAEAGKEAGKSAPKKEEK